MTREVRRGDLFWLDWRPAGGSEQSGRRPAVVIQTDAANRVRSYPNTIVAAVSRTGRPVPFHVRVDPDGMNGLKEVSYVKCEQILTVSRERLIERIGRLSDSHMEAVDDGLRSVLAL